MSQRRHENSKRLLLALTTALLVGFVLTAVVVAQSSQPAPESGSLEEVRYGSPNRTTKPEAVMRGTTAAGQNYALNVSRAGELLCLAVEYGAFTDGRSAQGPVEVRGSEKCVDPDERPVAASMEQLFLDPETGEVTETPQRFAYGVVSDKATRVDVRGPDGTSNELKLAQIPNSSVKAFAGSAPGSAASGSGSVIARDAAGSDLGRAPANFVGLGRAPEPPR